MPSFALECFVCKTPMQSAFKKFFDWQGLGEVVYVRCPECGFVASQTHAAMSDEAWAALNHAFHVQRDPHANRSNAARALARLEGYATAIADASAAGAIRVSASWLSDGAVTCQALASSGV